ncbi:hypothetical protein [Candidatus Acidianus copahuensis]|uniref:hypothetical protein n=1 Tax=Candidatus Acidianus copahuensis TaxID=1160895 RepID=UPI00135F1B78|nr:hypothetical protein [Candidatus Acidianus copahuensis]
MRVIRVDASKDKLTVYYEEFGELLNEKKFSYELLKRELYVALDRKLVKVT